MRYKITNFYFNKKIKFLLFNVLAFFIFLSNLNATSNYKMSIKDIKILNSSSAQASVYIENVGEELVLTSYQCALSINQSIDLESLSLSYVEGSSELLNEPNLYFGIENIDGPTELTFVSYIGNDIITKKTRVGTFILQGNLDLTDINILDIQWDFEGTVSTIITGKDFVNITNPANHESIFAEDDTPMEVAQVSVAEMEVSAQHHQDFSPTMLFDGYSSSNYQSSSERWAVEGFPQWVTIDLGEETYVDNIKLDAYGSEDGISYDCEFYRGTNDNKELIKKETTETGAQWSTHNLEGITTRYITMVVTGSEGNTWCDFWEIEIYGANSTTGVEDEEKEELAENEEIPSEYGISQNYPNPFNPSTKVQVKMKESGSVRLDVYNLLGERVLAILDAELTAGVHEVNIDGSDLASGIYIYQLNVNNQFSQIKKMNLVK